LSNLKWKNIFGGFIFGLFLAYRARRTVGGLQQTGGLSAAYSKWSFSGLQQIWPLGGLQGRKSQKKWPCLAYRTVGGLQENGLFLAYREPGHNLAYRGKCCWLTRARSKPGLQGVMLSFLLCKGPGQNLAYRV
jgi:hypothetical protein